MTNPPDLLADAARLTRQWADSLCTGGAGSCRPYHRAWTTLRLIGAISGARTDHEFFRQRFAAVARARPHANVLIIGTAYHAMLHMLLSGFRAEGAHPTVTIIDRCATTLALNDWYAKQVDAQVTTCESDLCNIDAVQIECDVITTHSVFSFAQPEEFASLFIALRSKLKLGGQLIFAQGLSPDLRTGSRVRFSAEESLLFQQKAVACLAERGGMPDLDATQVQALAQEFAANKDIGAIRSAHDLLGPLADAGFRLDHVEQIERSAQVYQSSAPQQHAHSQSLRVVATRID